MSLFPVKDYHAYEMSKLENGDTIRHPGHKVTEIF